MPFEKGYKMSEIHKQRISEALKGRVPARTGPHSEETKRKISEAMKKRPYPPKAGFQKGHGVLGSTESYKLRAKKISKTLTGRPQFHQRGDKGYFWKGGITSVNAQIRTSLEYKNWRRSVFERDDYTCQVCHARGVKIHADHIKPFSQYPELRLRVTNGRTLCVPCHKATDTYLNKAKIRTKKP